MGILSGAKTKLNRATEISQLIEQKPINDFIEQPISTEIDEPKKHLSFEISESRYEKINLYKLKMKKKSIKNIIEEFIDGLEL